MGSWLRGLLSDRLPGHENTSHAILSVFRSPFWGYSQLSEDILH